MNQTIERPPLETAIAHWKKILAEQLLPTDLIWIFEENLCVEKSRMENGGFHFGFQTRFTPPPDDALEIAFEQFAGTNARIVFYRLGDSMGKSVCTILCDHFFEDQSDAEGFLRRDDWGISFFAGQNDEIEEITELSRWVRSEKKDRPLHELDFCMSLATIDEITQHGRALAPYERFGQTMLSRLRRILGQG
jgi:hypothetical protein